MSRSFLTKESFMDTIPFKQSSAEYQDTKPYGFHSDVFLHLVYLALIVSYLGTLAYLGLAFLGVIS